MNRKITVLLVFAIIVTFNIKSSAQINIQSGVDPNAMVENIVGDGVAFDNVQYIGANSARGIFTNGSSTNLGIESGIFLTSGAGYVIPGPNTSCSDGSDNGMGGYPLLTALAGVSTYDASVLKFDFVPESDTLRFKYVFGSEEYNDYVFSTFNDVFGYFVSGPNPNGGYYSDKNVALIPGTNIPIAINNVNFGYSDCDIEPTGPCTHCEYYVDNTGGMTLEYDGFTAVLTAWIMVVPCETYTIKMAIADAGDHIFDSGVFLEENSFESPKIEVEAEPTPEGVSDNMVEGCVEADIIFRLPNSSYAPITINYEITGTADPGPGGDFEDPIPTSVTIEEGNDSAFIHVAPIQDGILEGDETLIFIITNELGCTVRYDTVEFIIVDYVDMVLSTTPDMAVCEGQTVELVTEAFNGISPYTYQWVEPSVENDTIEVTPEETTTYVVQVTDMCGGFVEDSVTVVVLPMPELELGNDTVVCGADSLVLHAGGGFASYQWQDGSTDSIYVVTEPGTYWVQVMASNGCVAGDQITVNFFPPIFVNLGNDTVICQGETITLDAGAGFESYYWQDGSNEQTYEVTQTGTFWVQVFDANGCTAFDTILVNVDNDVPSFSLGDDLTLCYGTTYTLSTGLPAGYQYEWQDGSTDSVYIVTQPGLYSVAVDGGCGTGYDTILINYNPPVNVDIGDDMTMCQGESVTLDAGDGFLSWTWQDGTTSQYYNVYESGIYYVQVTDVFGCTGSDTITIEVANNVQLIPDTSFCEGETIILDAGYGFDNYQWSTGSTSQIVHATEGGTYWVKASYVFGCPSSDTTVLTMFPVANADLGGDQDICEGDTILLTAPEGEFEYYWNDQLSDDNTYIVTQGGTYKLTMKNYCGEDSDEIEVTEYPTPDVTLGDDQVLFPGESVQLDPGEFISYLWQDGSTDRYYVVSYDNYSDSIYTVEVWDAHCKNSASVKIEIFNVEVPNVITPNGDGYNDTFRPGEGWSGIKSHKMVVVNRWGNKVWESSNFESGWDGKVNGKTVAAGTYFWVLEVTYGPDNKKKTYKGSLTVLGTD